MRRCASVAIILALVPAPARAHSTPATPETLWQTWNPDTIVVAVTLLSAWLYLRGVSALWRRAGAGRGIARWRVACFFAGLLSLVIAVVSPLDALSAALFSAHMAQHLLLILVAAPLLVLGAPLVPMLWALPRDTRRSLTRGWMRQHIVRSIWRGVSTPLVVLMLHAFAIWVWHLPPLYEGAIRHGWLHTLEHAVFLGTGLLFWWTLLPTGGHRRLSPGLGVLYVFAAAMQSGLLGVLMLLSPSAWYPVHAPYVEAWNMTPLEDQQLAGVIMWIPAGAIYTIAALSLFGAWLHATERSTRAREQRAAQWKVSAPTDAEIPRT